MMVRHAALVYLLAASSPADAKCTDVYVVVPNDYIDLGLLISEFKADLGEWAAGVKVARARGVNNSERDAADIFLAFDNAGMSRNEITSAVANAIRDCIRDGSSTPPPEPLSPAVIVSSSGADVQQLDDEAPVSEQPDSEQPDSEQPDSEQPAASQVGPVSVPVPPPMIVEAFEASSSAGVVYIPAPPPRAVSRTFASTGLAVGIATTIVGALLLQLDERCFVPSDGCVETSPTFETTFAGGVSTGLGALTVSSFGIALIIDELRLARWKTTQAR